MVVNDTNGHDVSSYPSHRNELQTSSDSSIPNLQQLINLPNEILLKILYFLPAEYIQEFFLYHPVTRPYIKSEFFNEVHFVVSPSRRPYVTSLSQAKRKYCIYKSYFDIVQFLNLNKDLVPRKILLVSGGDFQSLASLLVNHEEYFRQVPSLDITIDTHKLTDSDFNLLLSFPNLKRLHFSGIDLSQVKKYFYEPSPFHNHPGLQDIIFLGHSIYSWKNIHFPPSVRHLDLSWTKTDPLSIKLTDSISELYLNNAGINPSNLGYIEFPSHLKTLMMTYNKLESFDLNILPPNLETIDLSFNGIQWFTGSAWPASLKSIFLASNHLGDQEMTQLTLIPWPKNLQRLSVEANGFTDLNSLGNLASLSCLELLDIGLSEIRVLEGYEFPPSLRYLRMGSCEKIRWSTTSHGNGHNNFDGSTHGPTQGQQSGWEESKRVVFPPSLLELDLMSCKITSLHHFSFPPSLTKIALSGNRISDINSYEDENHSWTQLRNLVELDLFQNCIADLENWIPPASLKMLDFGCNRIKKLSHVPIFQEKFSLETASLYSINLSENTINAIDNIFLPENLHSLNLSKNLLESITLSPSVTSHKVLYELDLSKNNLESIRFSESGGGRIHLIDLTGNKLLKSGGGGALEVRKRMSQFYDELEAGFGIKVVARKFNVNGLHKAI